MKIKKVRNAVGIVGNVVDSLKATGVNDVPTVNAIKGKVLWENPRPTSEMSINTTITLSSDDYDILIWNFDLNVNVDPHYYVTNISLKGQNVRLVGVAQSNNAYRNINRISDTEYRALEGYLDADVQNRRAVPIKVIGYKIGL